MIGIIGGTGLYRIDGLEKISEERIQTPFGEPSAPLLTGSWNDRKLVFIPRHGSAHEFLPHEINYRANIWALKKIGVKQVLSVSAVGSLQQDLAPGDLAFVKQYIDFTKGYRKHSFFGEGISAHISTAEPICEHLRISLTQLARPITSAHAGAIYACVEGPRLGTRAESFFLKLAGATIVGMTNIPEAFLCREAQICYASIGIVTDYDCWLEDPSQHANTETILSLYKSNLEKVRGLLKNAIANLSSNSECSCRSALKGALLTRRESLNPMQTETIRILES